MKAILKSTDGSTKGNLDLPSQFNEPVRPDLIKRAVLALQSHRRQPHGTDPQAGKKYSSKLSRRRRNYRGAYGHGISRVPRKILSRNGTRFNWEAATVPNTVGGRAAHPPQVEKILRKEINKKERRKAIRSALSASVIKEFVSKRGHKVSDYPLVIEDSIESINKTKDLINLLNKLGLKDELERAAKKTQKSGKAKRRGRKHKSRKGPLFVVSKKCNLTKAAVNIPGVDIIDVNSLNVEYLAPGCDYGRLTIYTKSSIEILDKNKLFTDSPITEKVSDDSKARAKIEKIKQKKVTEIKTVLKETSKVLVKPKKEDSKAVKQSKPKIVKAMTEKQKTTKKPVKTKKTTAKTKKK